MSGQFVKLGARQRHLQVLGSGLVRGEEGQVDGGRGRSAQLDLRLFRRLADAAHGGGVAGEVDALAPLEFLHQIVGHAVVKVVAAQAVVAGGCEYLDDLVVDIQYGHVKRAAAQVKDHDLLRAALVHAIGQGGGGGLVDDAQNVKAGNAAGVLRGLALPVAEIGGHGDDRVADRLAQVGFGVLFELLQDDGADLLGRKGFIVNLDAVVGSHLTLDGGDGPAGVGHGLTLGRRAHDAFAVLRKGDHGRRGASSLCVGDHDGIAVFHKCHAGIGGAQINADGLAHESSSS